MRWARACRHRRDPVGIVVDGRFGAAVVPYLAAPVPSLGLLFILNEERKLRGGPAVVLGRPS